MLCDVQFLVMSGTEKGIAVLQEEQLRQRTSP